MTETMRWEQGTEVYITFLNTWIDVPGFDIQVMAKPEDPMGKFYIREAPSVQVQEDPPPWRES